MIYGSHAVISPRLSKRKVQKEKKPFGDHFPCHLQEEKEELEEKEEEEEELR